MSTKEDWTFDLGTDDKGFFQIEAWASTIPHRVFSRLTREQLLQLRREINSALRRYPKPELAPPLRPAGEKGATCDERHNPD